MEYEHSGCGSKRCRDNTRLKPRGTKVDQAQQTEKISLAMHSNRPNDYMDQISLISRLSIADQGMRSRTG